MDTISLYFGNLARQNFYNTVGYSINNFLNEWTLEVLKVQGITGFPYSIYSFFKDIHTWILGLFSLFWCCQFFLDQLGKSNNEEFFLPSEKLLLLQIEWQNIKVTPIPLHIDLKNCNSSFNMAISFCSKNLNPIHFKDHKEKSIKVYMCLQGLPKKKNNCKLPSPSQNHD